MAQDNRRINIINELGPYLPVRKGSKKALPPKEELKKAALATLDLEGIRNKVEINVLLVGNKKIRQLNKEFLSMDNPTDVMAFGSSRKGRGKFLGDVVISAEMADYNTGRFHTSLKQEICLYVIHGILHLLGYDHAKSRDRELMEKRQSTVLKTLRIE